MSKKKTEEEEKIILESGTQLDYFFDLLKTKDKTLNREKIAEIMNISQEQLSKFTKGKNSPPFFRIYKFIKNHNVSINDIVLLFNIKFTKIDVKEDTISATYSVVPKINEKILILKQIYESGDEILMGSVDMCLKGAYEDFLEKKRKKTG